MNISSIDIRSLVAHVEPLSRNVETHSTNALDKEKKISEFNKIFNELLTKEMLKPVLQSISDTSGAQYGFMIQDVLTEHFSNLYNVVAGPSVELNK